MRRYATFLTVLTLVAIACKDQPVGPTPDPDFARGGIPGPPPGKGPPPGAGPPPGTPIPPGAGPPAFLADFIQVDVGRQFSCGLLSTGEAFCWGLDDVGQLGNGSAGPSPTPTPVAGGLTFSSITLGDAHACGIDDDDDAYCWGANFAGELGAGLPTGFGMFSDVPVLVSGNHKFVQLDAGLRHGCGVATDGFAYCWGTNFASQLGDGTTNVLSNVPIQVVNSLTLGFQSVSAGGLHTCGLDGSGTAFCWGTNNFGEIGDGTQFITRPTPTPVAGGISFSSISAGAVYTCGLDQGGAAFCWGFDLSQLGTGTKTEGSELSPVAVVGGLSFTSLRTMDKNSIVGHTCGVTAVGDAYCWGNNEGGQLGAATTETCTLIGVNDFDCSTIPVAVSGGIQFRTVSPGVSFAGPTGFEYHTCGVALDGAAYCWGWNGSGQLGDGSTTPSPVPVPVVRP